MKKIWTPDGLQRGIQQSWVGKGESIINYDQGKAALVDKGKVGVDNQPSSVQEDDDNVIAGNDVDWSNGMTFASQIAPMAKIIETVNKAERQREKNAHLSSLNSSTQKITDQEKQKVLGQMKNITDRQAAQHQYENNIEAMNQYKCGKSRFDDGVDIPIWQRAIPSLFGLGTAYSNYRFWKKNPVKYHDTYSPNYNAPRALQIMATNRVNPYAAVRAAYDAERRGNYALDQMGGLTGAQRYTGKVAAALGNAKNIADIYMSVGAQNAALRNQYAEALGKYGDSDATRRQNARQHDWADYVAAHGAKIKGIMQSKADMVNQLNNWYSNEFKYNTWQDSYNLYRDQLNDEKKRWIAEMAAKGYNPDGTVLKKQSATRTSGIPTTNTPAYSGTALYQFNPATFWSDQIGKPTPWEELPSWNNYSKGKNRRARR